MKATLITYSAKGLNKTESSKISKGLIGYTDKSNKAKYTYERQGLINTTKSIIVSKSTFIIPRNKTKEIISYIRTKGAKILSWNINIPDNYFKK